MFLTIIQNAKTRPNDPQPSERDFGDGGCRRRVCYVRRPCRIAGPDGRQVELIAVWRVEQPTLNFGDVRVVVEGNGTDA